MPQYLLLLYDDPTGWAKLSSDERKWWMEKYGAYRERLQANNAWVGGQKLADEPGRVVRGVGEDIRVTDGPYSETKEWLGGYFLIEVPNYNAALELARECPNLLHGGTIEVREVDARTAKPS